MSIFVVGLNHKTADVEVREKLAFNGDKLERGLSGLLGLTVIDEVVILSTCNRVEIYLKCSDNILGVSEILDFLSRFHAVDRDTIEGSLYIYKDLDGVKHVFRVAASLDSMVLGEPQILGQIKDAYQIALSNKTTGVILNRLMKKAISVSKRIRTETKISENAVSISYAAVELAKKIFTDLKGKVFMLLGAGEMAELAARHLMNCGLSEVLVSNRTYERGCSLASDFNGKPIHFENFKNEMARTDIVICSTGAPEYILYKRDMQKIIKERRYRPVFIIDISVPRNIDPDINNIDNVYLYDVDDLQSVVDSNMDGRQQEALKADEIINNEIETFSAWLQSLKAVPTIVALRSMAEAVKTQEITRLFNKLNGIGDREKKAIEGMATSLVNKLIHHPTVVLKEETGDKDLVIDIVKRLYGLDNGP